MYNNDDVNVYFAILNRRFGIDISLHSSLVASFGKVRDAIDKLHARHRKEANKLNMKQ